MPLLPLSRNCNKIISASSPCFQWPVKPDLVSKSLFSNRFYIKSKIKKFLSKKKRYFYPNLSRPAEDKAVPSTCKRVFTRSNGWNNRVEQVPLKDPAAKAFTKDAYDKRINNSYITSLVDVESRFHIFRSLMKVLNLHQICYDPFSLAV